MKELAEFKITAQVIQLNPDVDQFSGEQYTQVVLAVESPIPRPPPQVQQMTPFPIPRPVAWKHVLYVFVPNTKWNNQFQMWQKYDIIIKDTGELELKLSKEGV